MKIFMYVMVAIGATGVLFGTARFFARPPPATMTKEYQEASNEYLKVCSSHEINHCPCDGASVYICNNDIRIPMLTTLLTTGPQRRAHHWYLIRGLRRPRSGPECSCEEIDTLHRERVGNERNVVKYPVEQARLFAK